MPEGPEIRRAADQVADVIVNQAIDSIRFAFSHLRRYERCLCDSRIERIETRGKAMLTVFENGYVIYSHNQLYGVWKTLSTGEAWPETKRQVRLEIVTANGAARLYSASDIEVFKYEKAAKHPFLKNLGPDILSDKPTRDDIVLRLQSATFNRKQLASLLLSQQFLAGLGNYLRAEILFYAKLNPTLRPDDCSEKQLNTLARWIITVTERSYKTGGITNSTVQVKRLKASGVSGYEAYRFCVYGREGMPCYTCGETIVRSNSGGRGLYYCPQCQPK